MADSEELEATMANETEDTEETEEQDDETANQVPAVPWNVVDTPVPQVQPMPAENRLGGWSTIKTILVRCIIMYAISSFFRQGKPTTPEPAPGQGAGVAPIAGQAKGNALATPGMGPSSNVFMKNMEIDMYMYLNEEQEFTDFNNKDTIFWIEEDLIYGDWTSGVEGDGSYTKQKEITLSEAMMNNASSLYLHVFFVRAGYSPDPKDQGKHTYDEKCTLTQTYQINKFKKRKFHSLTNLLTGTTDVNPDLVRLPNETQVEILSHWHDNITINLIDDHTPWTRGMVPSPLDESIKFIAGTPFYYPILYFNNYWSLNRDYLPINETTPQVNISVTYAPMSLFKWQMYAAQGMRNKWFAVLGEEMMEESDDDQDAMKIMFLETSPYLLGITICVSIVHSVFEFLAFKNDIQFWKNKKSMTGLSVRSVFFNVFQSLIIVLYVLDNETNFMIRCTVFIGLAIEVWKITKVVDVKIDFENKIGGVIPRVVLKDKSTYTESETKKYDQLAFKYLSWALFPIALGYSVYSMMYNEHKGWYSFVLNTMYGFLLIFGFIMMTPQLFINYKLKSVAHLPWRMLTYKALNTFIDDLFAFVIKMPTLYRIGCFRDDIVFLIYVYQRYAYRIDPTRMNEFGTSGDMHDPAASESIADTSAEETSNGQALPIENKVDSASVDGAVSSGSNGSSPNSKKSKHKNKKNKKAKKDD